MHVDPVEIELAAVAVVELRRLHFVSAAAARIRGVVTPVEGGGYFDLDEVCRCSETRGGFRAEDFFGGCKSAIGSTADTRTQIGSAGAEIQLVRFPVHRAAALDDVQEVVGAVETAGYPSRRQNSLPAGTRRPGRIHSRRSVRPPMLRALIPALTRAYPRVLYTSASTEIDAVRGSPGQGSAFVSGLSKPTPNFMPAPAGKSPPPRRIPFHPPNILLNPYWLSYQYSPRSIVERPGGTDWLVSASRAWSSTPARVDGSFSESLSPNRRCAQHEQSSDRKSETRNGKQRAYRPRAGLCECVTDQRITALRSDARKRQR